MIAPRLFPLVLCLALLSCKANGPAQKAAKCPVTCKSCDDKLMCLDCKPGVALCVGDAVTACNEDGTLGDVVKQCDAASGEKCKGASCASPCEVAASTHSYLGCDYWPTTLLNRELDARFDFAVAIANPAQIGDATTGGPATVKVVLGKAPCDLSGDLTDGVAYATIPAGDVKQMILPWVSDVSQNGAGNEVSTDVPDGAYHLCSSLPVTVYQFNPLEYQRPQKYFGAQCPTANDFQAAGFCHSFTNDASLLLPSTALGKDYIVAAYGSFGLQQLPSFFNPKGSVGTTPGFFTIVGTADKTTVTITYSAFTEGGVNIDAASPGDVQTYTIDKGEVLEVISARPTWSQTNEKVCVRKDMDFQSVYCDEGKQYDVTGTKISATAPVAVFGGHSCAFVPYNKWACDHMEEQIFPLDTWGQQAVAVQSHPTAMGEPNLFRVIAGTDATMITFDPPVAKAQMLNTGEWMEFIANGGFQVTGSNASGMARILAVQYMVGENYGSGNFFTGKGDPSMSLVVPTEQLRKSYDFLTPDSYIEQWLTVIGLVGTTYSLDGGMPKMIDPASAIGASGYGFVYEQLDMSGGHHITSDSPFAINVSGVAPFTSYLFPGGLNLIELNPG